MTSLTNATVLVIGAAGGIGQSLCAALHAAGATVIGTTKDAGKLSSLATTTSSQRVLDLADGDSIAAFLDDIEAEDVALTGIIVAAGVVGFGNAVDVPAAGFDRMMAINATGPIHVLSALSPIVGKSGDGFVVTLSGMIAETPMAGLSAYSASKAALHAFSVAAGREFRRIGVRFVDARPGHTESGLATRALFGEAPNFGAGLTTDAVAARIVAAIVNDEKDLPSAAFL
jgi:NAD(P)-dependent dehydrogenase (short-subunit alcohol dehydrogenase family)